jgi:hypothetical protein
MREVRDRDYFFLWSFSAWGVWAALGLVFLWESVASYAGNNRRSWALASPVLALALIPLFANWSTAPRKGQTDARDFAADLLNSVEPYGVLVVVGDNDTFPLWYAQEVEGIRKDVVVICTSLANTDWYARQVARRPVYEYDAANGPAIYANRTWTKPAHGPLNRNVFEADSIPQIVALPKAMEFVKGDLHAVLDPRLTEYPGYLQRSDLLILMMIQDSWPERPFYFSRSSGPLVQQLGLTNQVIQQGLASKVFVPTQLAKRDTVYLPETQAWFDVARTKALWDSVYQAPESLIRRGSWIDEPSLSIPYMYLATGATLAQVLGERGDAKAAAQVFDTTRKVAAAVGIETRATVDRGGGASFPADSPAPP